MQDKSPRTSSPAFADVLNARLSRRGLLQTGAGALVLAGAAPVLGLGRPAAAEASGSTFTFKELPRIYDKTHHVADGYRADVLLRWGDKVTASAPEFDPATQTVESQSAQAGYNNDHIAFMPLPLGSQSSGRGLLVVNNEYPSLQLMFPALLPPRMTRARR